MRLAEDGVSRCTPLFRTPIWCPLGGWRHARGREHCRGEPGSSLSGGYAPDSVMAEGSSIIDEPGEPLCARIKGANREVSEGKLMSDHDHFSSYEGHKERRTGKIHGAFKDMHRALDGWMLARAPASPASWASPPWTAVFQFSLFMYDVWP